METLLVFALVGLASWYLLGRLRKASRGKCDCGQCSRACSQRK